MKLLQAIQPDAVVVPLSAATKQGAIHELADRLTGACGLGTSTALRDAVWQRELTRTTGIGYGVAIPHGKCPGLGELRMAVGRTLEPLEFGAIDGQPVRLIFLVASTPDQTGPHIQALAAVTRMLCDEDVREAMKRATDPSDLLRIVAQYEQAAAAPVR